MRIVFGRAFIVVGLGLSLLVAGCASSQPTANPEMTSNQISSDSQVNTILDNSCFQCHSSEKSAPWYASISPSYLFGANSARRVLNFSNWRNYDADQKTAALNSIAKSIASGSMPPGDYTAFDGSARLSDDDKQAVLKWAALPAH
jgi:heme-binding protein